MRRSRPFILALSVVVGLCSGALAVAPVSAGGVSDQEKTVQEVLAELDRMHQKADQYAEDIVVALDQKTQIDAQIVVAQQKIAEQEAQLAVLETQLGNVAVEKVMGGGSGALGPLFADPVAIDESLQRDHLARVAVDAGAATSNDYDVLLEQLQTEQRSLEDKQAQAVALAEQAESSRIKAEQAVKDLEARQAKEKQKLGALLEQEEQRQAAAAAAQYAKEVKEAQARSAAQAAAAANKPSTSSGGTSSGNSSSGNASSGNAGSGSSGSSGNAGSGSDSGSDSGSSGSGDDSGSSGGGASVPPVSSRASVAVNAAASQQGVPYRYATSSPGVNFDCSGLTAYAWGVAGVGIPHQSGQQYASTPHVPKEQAQPGDLIFYYSPISHVGIYIGGGSMIHAPSTGKVVSVTTVRWDKVVGVSRPG